MGDFISEAKSFEELSAGHRAYAEEHGEVPGWMEQQCLERYRELQKQWWADHPEMLEEDDPFENSNEIYDINKHKYIYMNSNIHTLIELEWAVTNVDVSPKILPHTTRHVLNLALRAVLTEEGRVIDGYTCIIQSRIAKMMQMPSPTVHGHIERLMRLGLIEKLEHPPPHKNGRYATYIKLAACVLSGDVTAIKNFLLSGGTREEPTND